MSRFLTVQQYRKKCGVLGKRGPKGRKLCACGVEVAPPRLHWCSDSCFDEWKVENDWTFIRYRVEARDHGICVLCGWDTNAAHSKFLNESRGVAHSIVLERAKMMGIPPGRMFSDWWDADHIVPVVEGGSNRIDNLRTLCLPCHRKETAALRKRMSKRHIEAKPVPLFDGVAC
jgi:5-methylcytosine-specific restriction endonuclease McrA